MYKNYNMSQISLPLTTEFTFAESDTASIVNEIIEKSLKQLSTAIKITEAPLLTIRA